MAEILIKKKDNNQNIFIDISFPVVDIIPITVRFSLNNLGFDPIEYVWDFGDGNLSNESDPVHTYNSYGYHYINVKVRKNDNTWETIKDDNCVIILGRIDFSSNITKGDKPLEVQFENRSISPTGYQFDNFIWDFGDGFSATGPQGPFHIYNDYGNYSVKLKADLEPI